MSSFFKILNCPFKLIIFLVTEYLHRPIIVKGYTFLNRITADTVCSSIYVRITVSVKHQTDRKPYTDVSSRKNADATCFLVTSVWICQACKCYIRQVGKIQRSTIARTQAAEIRKRNDFKVGKLTVTVYAMP